MTRHPKKNIKAVPSTIQSIPYELLCEVLCRVATSSLNDIFNVKLSCKSLNEVTEDAYIYRCISLDKFPIVPWRPLSEKQEAFLNKCKACGNPELMYRQAVLDYFNKANLVSARQNLERARKSGHVGALYLTSIVLLFSRDDDDKQEGMKIIGRMRKSKSSRRKLIQYRNNLINMLERMWVKNPLLKEGPAECCTRQHQRHWKIRWSDDEEEDEEEDNCEACCADREISYIRDRYSW